MAIVSKYGKERFIDNGRARVNIGSGEGEYRPYDLLFGALSACYFYTLESLAKKLRVNYDEVTISVDGTKKDDKIATLKDVYFTIEAEGVSDKEKFEKVCELAGKYCSIHVTVAQVSNMHHEIIFK